MSIWWRALAFWTLVVFVFSIPTENGVAIPGVGSLSRFIGMAAFAFGLLALFQHRRMTLRLPSLFLLVAIAFVTWSAMSFFWSVSPGATLGRVLTYVQLVVMVWLIWEFCRTEKARAILLQAFVFGSYVSIFIAIFVFATSDTPAFRNVGAGFNPNGFAIKSAICIPIAWWLGSFWRSKVLYWLNVLYIPLALIGVILAASRGGLLTTLVALAILPLGFAGFTWRRRLGIAALAIALTLTGFYYAPQFYPDLSSNLERLGQTQEQLTEGTLTGRRIIWDAGIEVFQQSPLYGVGAGAFRYAVEPILGQARPPHNAFLSVLVDLGIIGLLLYGALFVIVAWSLLSFNGPLHARLFLWVLFLALLVGMSPTNSDNDKFAWFVLAMLISYSTVVLHRVESRFQMQKSMSIAPSPIRQ